MPGVLADFDKNKKLIGIEILDASSIIGQEIEFELPKISKPLLHVA